MPNVTLPFPYFYYLRVFADLRRTSMSEAVDFLLNRESPGKTAWVSARYPELAGREPRNVEVSTRAARLDRQALTALIDGLPPEIRPVTDGPWASNLRIQPEGDFARCELDDVVIYDWLPYRNRERAAAIYPLVSDLIPDLSIDEYGLFRDFGSQFWRLLQEPARFTMPDSGRGGLAIDAGAYVGHKALAMARRVGAEGQVVAFEADEENAELLLRTVNANPWANITPVRVALGAVAGAGTLFSRDARSMAHSLMPFESFIDPSAIDRPHNKTDIKRAVQVTTLADELGRLGISQVDSLHVSVTGFELEVVMGVGEMIRRIPQLRISCPYFRGGKSNVWHVQNYLKGKGVDTDAVGSAVILNPA